MTLLTPIPGSDDLLAAVQAALGPNRLPLVIGLDGQWGAGKSGVASWLGWQLGMPAVALDLYIIRDSNPLGWRYDDLTRVIEARMLLRRPLIIEGICLCRVLQAIDREPDFLVWVDNKSGPTTTRLDPTTAYLTEFEPERNADLRLVWEGR